VLVAEDDPEMRRLIVEALRKDGYVVEEEADGGRLLTRLGASASFEGRCDAFDLIVSDIRMPICSGLEVVKGLRDQRCETPVILMTAFGDEDTRARAHELGAVLFEKPFEMKTLRLIAKGLLQHANSPSSP
jgi:DNA-binding response OmpR family regulator